jgi:AcrR family transcriptional regulator
MELNNQTELSILSAAERVFYVKGKNGTSMQDIADEAGITRTSLNYYYRSKDKLFEAVFRQTMELLIPNVSVFINSDRSISEYLPQLVELVIYTMIENPQIPVFVLQELSSNPERLPQIWAELGINPAETLRKMKLDSEISDINFGPQQIIMNVISMCIFPFAAKPLLVSLMFGGEENSFIEAMEQRKVLIPLMIQNMIKSKKS